MSISHEIHVPHHKQRPTTKYLFHKADQGREDGKNSDDASLPTYCAFGVGAVLALIYMTNWETVGRRIPVWKYHFEPIAVENSNATGDT
ncbi:unnamed protein product [Onchocerca ochengi]|uniref:Transmembrane protein n=1 Tax=Onchocerca ochengi TaxID=42157 RepID=A0A182DXN9_ONCOC|nr:unnamed protein product [Onchocerca ochengi]